MAQVGDVLPLRELNDPAYVLSDRDFDIAHILEDVWVVRPVDPLDRYLGLPPVVIERVALDSNGNAVDVCELWVPQPQSYNKALLLDALWECKAAR